VETASNRAGVSLVLDGICADYLSERSPFGKARNTHMAKGDTHSNEITEAKDKETGRRILRLTNNGAKNHHIYLNHPAFTADGKRLV